MSTYPGASSVFSNQGGAEAMIGDNGVAIPITIDGSRLGSATATVKLKAPYLFARRSTSPYKAVPFQSNGAIANPTNTTNATVDIPDADAVRFRVNDSCTYYDVSLGALHSESKVISAIGAPGSGGAGETLVTFTGVWTTAPVATDLLVVADGAQLSANAVMVMEDIEFDGSTDAGVNGYITGIFQKSAVNNASRFVQADNQGIKLVDVQ